MRLKGKQIINCSAFSFCIGETTARHVQNTRLINMYTYLYGNWLKALLRGVSKKIRYRRGNSKDYRKNIAADCLYT